jgi:hypothetical protein
MNDLSKKVIELIQSHGVRMNSKSWGDYQDCKTLLDTLDLSPTDWFSACQIIADYLGL